MVSKAAPSRHDWNKTLADYLDWGAKSGRKDGSPWSKGHIRNMSDHFREWNKTGVFQHVEDVTPTLYEQHVEAMRVHGFSPKYRRGRETAMHSFLNWCVARKIVAENPLSHCRKSSDKAKKQCRAFTFEEFARLHKTVGALDAKRALLYRTAVLTGFRQSELRSLKTSDVTAGNEPLIHLHAEFEKLRVERWFPTTPTLARALKSDVAGALLTLTHTPIQRFDKDLAAAGINKHEGGTLDFHGLRRTGITWLGILGAPASVRHAFSRHSDQTTNQRYDLASQELLRSWIIKMEKALEDYESGKVENGGGYRDRTGDLQTASLTLSQLS